MAVAKNREYTVDDIYLLPEGVRAELIEGRIYGMAPPNRRHQRISGYLYQGIANYIDSKKGLCEVYSAPFAVFLNNDEKTYVEPDISVICDQNKLNDKGCDGAPDWIIEVASPTNASHDYVLKLKLYMEAGVREYWIVNPEMQMVTVYDFEDQIFFPYQYTFQDRIKVSIYDDLFISFNELDRNASETGIVDAL